MISVSRFRPSKALEKFVKCYYHLQNDGPVRLNDTYFADGCIEAVFSLGWEFHKDGKKEPWAKIIGQIVRPRTLTIVGKGESFGIWFYPHAFSRFTNLPLNELNDTTLAWDALFPKSFAEFAGACMADKQVDRLVATTNSFLIGKMARFETRFADVIAEAAVGYLYSNKLPLSADQLAYQLGISPRYLQKIFLSKVGFSQKFLLRVLRMQQALQQLNQRKVSSLASVAHTNNFFDQSHFIREFKSFTGILPSQFEATLLPINQHFLSES